MSADTCPKVGVRPATPADARRLWEWRNEPGVRSASFSSAPIPFADHERWLAARLTDPRSAIYIALDDGGREIGYVRFDVDDDEARISAAIAPALRGRGLGHAAIREGVRAFTAARPDARIVALILRDNRRSETAFLKAGFVPAGGRDVGAVPAVALRWPAARS